MAKTKRTGKAKGISGALHVRGGHINGQKGLGNSLSDVLKLNICLSSDPVISLWGFYN